MSPFKPLGEQSRWKILYELLCATDTNELITYQQMADALGLDPERHRPIIASAVRRAAEEHLDVDQRAIEVVRGEGYRVVKAEEQLRIARMRNKRAKTQLAIAYSTATKVDLTNIDPEVRKALETLARGFLDQMEINSRISARQRKTEKVLNAVSQRTDHAESELSGMRERLAALESRLDAPDSA